ncbi:MAG: HAMP domain-containing sensor histidine kinase [Candidatus Eremiobacterota bacterium]
MRLRFRLAASYLLVVLLFVVTLSWGWAVFSARPALQWLSRAVGELELKLAESARQAHREGGWPEVRTVGRAALLPPDSQMVLYVPGRPPELLQGTGRAPDDLAALQAAAQGQRVLRPPRALGPRKVSLWLPLPEGGALSITVPSALPPEVRREVQRGLLLATLIGALVAFSAGLVLSSRIAGPVVQLARAADELGAGALDRRVPVGAGRDELTELARRFNLMAERLEASLTNLSREKSRAERLEQAQRQFLSDLSHNLRTPLAAVLGWTETLLDGLAPGEEEQHLERIRREVLYVSQTLQRLVDLSRWEEHGPELRRERFALQHPLAEAVDTLAPAAEARGMSLSLDGPVRSLDVEGDPQRVRELFQILLENSVQHAGEGARIRVMVESDRETARVTVADDGPGFLLDHPQESVRSQGRGPGLGLAIARRLARAHGGELVLQSAPEGGTRASFTLPLQTSQLP